MEIAQRVSEFREVFSVEYIERLKRVLDIFPHEQFEKLIEVMLNAYENDKQIFVMGNGGSAATASHWVCDINKGCSQSDAARFRMISLNDNIAAMLAYANDLSYEDVFVEQLKNLFNPGDVVIGISGSGESSNVLRAINYARSNGGETVGLCGFSGGSLYGMVDVPILVEVDDMQMTEDVHLILVHMSMRYILRKLRAEEL